MPGLEDFRAQYPQYDDIPDEKLVDAMHQKFYSDIPRDVLFAKLGLTTGPKPPPPSGADIAKDIGQSFGIGAVKGGIGMAGLAGDAGQLGAKASEWVGGKIGGMMGLSPEEQAQRMELAQSAVKYNPLSQMPTSEDIQKKVEGVTGKFYDPKTTAGQYAQTIGEFVPSVLGGPGGLVRRGASAVTSGLASEAAGQATAGTAAEPYARAAGGIAGGIVPGAVARGITPFPNPTRAADVNILRNEGVTDLTAGQMTGRKGLQYFESEMGGGAAANMADRSGEQFTRAALRRIGEDAPRATHEVMDRAFTRIGQVFDDVAARNPVRLDRNLGQELARVEGEYNALVSQSQRAPIVGDVIRDIGDIAAQSGGVMSGEAYGAMRSRLERMARGAKADPQLSDALRGIRGALDDALARGIRHTADLQDLREARRQYRNIIPIERAIGTGTVDAEQGLITPNALNQAIKAQGVRAKIRGQGDFAELASAGKAVMQPLPNSGTAGRMAAHGWGSIAAGAGLGGAGGASVGLDPMFAALVGAGVPRAMALALLSGPGRRYFSNQALPPTQPGSLLGQAGLNALLSRTGGLLSP